MVRKIVASRRSLLGGAALVAGPGALAGCGARDALPAARSSAPPGGGEQVGQSTRPAQAGQAGQLTPTGQVGQPTPGPQEAGASLRDLTGPLGVWIGAAVTVAPLLSDRTYAETARRECSVVTPENEMKWEPTQPTRDRYDFTRADAIVDFAQAAGIAVHGHTLVWHNQNPAWLTGGVFSGDEQEAILREHIATVVGRYAGRVAAWDVVNEALAQDGTLRPNLWLQRLGPGYLALAFQAAHEADPQARLLYNDFDAEGMNAKSDGVYRVLADLLAQGAPLHGVGFQMHATSAGVPAEPFARNLERFAALGLDLYVTEMDVRLPLPPSAQSLAAQAAVYRSVLEVCLAQPAFRGFQTWGLTDRHSWIPGRYPGFGAALPLDQQYAPKPSYDAIRAVLSQAAERRRGG